MNKIHICLVSEQTIPNILGIHHFKPDEILFITTEKMEKNNKVSSILKTLNKLGLKYDDKNSNSIIVQEDSILDCHRKIEDWIRGKEDAEFVVNLTCGTKIMSISAYEYFKDYNSKMIYIPIPKNEFIVPFPKRNPGKPIPLNLRLNVVQYLTAYGLDTINEPKLEIYKENAIERKTLSEWIFENYNSVKNLLKFFNNKLKNYRNENIFDFSEHFNEIMKEEYKKILAQLNFTYNNDLISKQLNNSEIKFLTGGWLEEFCFNTVLEFIGKGIDDVVLGIEIKNNLNRNNEFDVMFTKDNALYFIECKSLDQDTDRGTDVLYKIGALQKEFGLRINSFLITTSNYIFTEDGKIKDAVKARAEQFNTKIIPPSDVQAFKESIVRELKL